MIKATFLKVAKKIYRDITILKEAKVKKFICILLAAVAVLALCACAVKNDVEPLKVKGDKVTAVEFEQWQKEVEALIEADEAANKLPEAQWYSLKCETYTESNGVDNSSKTKVTVSGKVYVSPFVHECKAKVKMTTVNEVVEKENKTVTTTEANIIFINNVSYSEITTTVENADGKTVETEKKREESDFEFGYITSVDVVEIDKDAEVYRIKNGFLISKQLNYNLGTGDEKTECEQISVQLKKNSTQLEKMSGYTGTTTSENGVKTVYALRLDVKASTGTTVKRPNDYFMYEEE